MRTRAHCAVVVVLTLTGMLESQEQAPEATLKSGKAAAELWQFPARDSAPVTYEDMKSMGFPKDNEFDLKFPSRQPGWYTGPDGGKIYLWAPNHYRWTMQNGAELMQFPNGTWELKQGKFVFDTYPGSCPTCKNRRRLCFPDKTCLSGFYYKTLKQRHHVYQNFPEYKSHLLMPQEFRPLHEAFDRYQFHFYPEHQAYVHAFRDWPGKDAFFALMKSEWNFENRGIIPAIMFRNLREFQAYRETVDKACGGGRGGENVIYFCDERKGAKAQPESDDPKIRAIQYRSEYIQVILHETTHNLQQLRCEALLAGKPAPDITSTVGAWLQEGQANLGAMRGYAPFRAERYETFFKTYVTPGRKPNLDRDDPYLAGAMFLEYLAERSGLKAIGTFYDQVCIGANWRDAFTQVFGGTREAVLNEMLQYYAEQMPAFAATLHTWRIDGAPALSESAAGSSTRVTAGGQFPASPAAISDYAQIPDILHAYDYDLPPIKGMYTLVRGGAGEAIEIFPNGSYRVSTPEWEAMVFPDTETHLKMDGYEITNWAKGNARRIKFPGGKTKDMFPPR